jgi:hypothetical protein
LTLLMVGSLNGDPGEELEWPGVVPPAVSLAWQDWLGGPVPLPLGFPPPAYAIGAAAPLTMMPARQLAAKSLCIMIAFRSGARRWRTYTLNTLLSGGQFNLHTVAPSCEFAGRPTSRATGPDAVTRLPPALLRDVAHCARSSSPEAPAARVHAATIRPLPLYTHRHGSSFNAMRFSNPNQSTLATIFSEISRRVAGGRLAATTMAS